MLDTLCRIARSMAAAGLGPSAWILRSKPSWLAAWRITLQARAARRVGLPGDVGEADHTTAADLGEEFGSHLFGGPQALAVELAVADGKKTVGTRSSGSLEESGAARANFGFAAFIESAAGLDLDGGGAVAHHGFEASARAVSRRVR